MTVYGPQDRHAFGKRSPSILPKSPEEELALRKGEGYVLRQWRIERQPGDPVALMPGGGDLVILIHTPETEQFASSYWVCFADNFMDPMLRTLWRPGARRMAADLDNGFSLAALRGIDYSGPTLRSPRKSFSMLDNNPRNSEDKIFLLKR